MPTILSRMLSTLAAAAQTADRIDYWIRRHVIEYWDETHPSQLKWDPGPDRRVGLPALPWWLGFIPDLPRIGNSEHDDRAVGVRSREVFRGSKSKAPPSLP